MCEKVGIQYFGLESMVECNHHHHHHHQRARQVISDGMTWAQVVRYAYLPTCLPAYCLPRCMLDGPPRINYDLFFFLLEAQRQTHDTIHNANNNAFRTYKQTTLACAYFPARYFQ